MCDIVPGQLIVCFPRGDAIGAELIAQIRDNEIEHVSYVESLDERLHAMALPIDTTLKYSLHLLEVPEMQCTINLVPSLLLQILAYTDGGASDRISLSHFVPMRMKRRGVEILEYDLTIVSGEPSIVPLRTWASQN